MWSSITGDCDSIMKRVLVIFFYIKQLYRKIV
ncbi:hypothetical protein F0726_01191 [Acidithiobacillus caldus]|nr:hypothetical protein F0726_01191 [Acidithiobacillus caldus]